LKATALSFSTASLGLLAVREGTYPLLAEKDTQSIDVKLSGIEGERIQLRFGLFDLRSAGVTQPGKGEEEVVECNSSTAPKGNLLRSSPWVTPLPVTLHGLGANPQAVTHLAERVLLPELGN
jgi:hypothetical protein